MPLGSPVLDVLLGLTNGSFLASSAMGQAQTYPLALPAQTPEKSCTPSGIQSYGIFRQTSSDQNAVLWIVDIHRLSFFLSAKLLSFERQYR